MLTLRREHCGVLRRMSSAKTCAEHVTTQSHQTANKKTGRSQGNSPVIVVEWGARLLCRSLPHDKIAGLVSVRRQSGQGSRGLTFRTTTFTTASHHIRRSGAGLIVLTVGRVLISALSADDCLECVYNIGEDAKKNEKGMTNEKRPHKTQYEHDTTQQLAD
jgi:hypothetical protein